MLDLAMNSGARPVTLREVAARQSISEKYLEQIIIKLSKAGLVRGTRGARGGYVLSREPGEISVGDILRVVEGGLAPVECVNCARGECLCNRADTCITIDLWRDIKEAVEQVVDQRSLSDLVESYLAKNIELNTI